MFTVYLPIAEMSVNFIALIALGSVVGFLSGVFGVGGGFLMTPLLIFMGIPAPIAVASGLNQIVASSVSGVIPHWTRGNVDLVMAMVLLVGGMAGSGAGILLFNYIKSLGQIDLLIKLSYVILLCTIGSLMILESKKTINRQKKAGPIIRSKLHRHNWMHGLPNKIRFRKSNLYISIYPPLVIGFLIGVMTAIMGVGGGFLMIPAMIYFLGMPTLMVVGTSLLQIIIVSAGTTFMQAYYNQSVDITLSLILIIGGVVGAQFGSLIAPRLKGEMLRYYFSLIVTGLGLILLINLLWPPANNYFVNEITPLSDIEISLE